MGLQEVMSTLLMVVFEDRGSQFCGVGAIGFVGDFDGGGRSLYALKNTSRMYSVIWTCWKRF
jgi:hypothetical protein